jgi:hypothetical protein
MSGPGAAGGGAKLERRARCRHTQPDGGPLARSRAAARSGYGKGACRPLARFGRSRTLSGYWAPRPPDVALPPVDIRPGVRGDPVAGAPVMSGAGGAGGGVKLPDCRRASSAWFSSLATLFPCTFGKRLGWCAALPRARRCFGGIAELVSDIEEAGGAAEGT